jgi:hypothetical protein
VAGIAPVRTRVCPRCDTEKDASEFYRSNKTKDGLSSACKVCNSAYIKKRNIYEVSVTESKCIGCGLIKPASEFGKTRGRKCGLKGRCKPCEKIDIRRRLSGVVRVTIDTEKKCRDCGEVKPINLFYNMRAKVDGKGSVCKPCMAIRNDKTKSTLRGYARYKIYHAKKYSDKIGREFSITFHDVLELWELQKGLCYYTGTPMMHVMNGGEDYIDWDGMSIDRIDSSRGYTRDNIVLCKLIANLSKSNMTQAQYFDLCEQVVSLHGNRVTRD